MTAPAQHPNIIILYADDLGFGDVGCYGATGIPTPNIDRLAAEGVKFHQGYATAATCTPSRYSLLTGSYPWRNDRARILPGDAPMIISRDTQNLPSLLRQAGYRTSVVGKWHLGLGDGGINWNSTINGTPLDMGFDESYIMAATNDRVPCVYVDGREVQNLDPEDPIEVCYDPSKPFPGEPTGKDNPELLTMNYSHGHDMAIVNGVSRIGYMRGGKSALWEDQEMGEVFLNRAQSLVTQNKDRPFFLYYAFHQPHVPRIPSRRFVGSTGLGPRGDVIAEMDWCVGKFLKRLDDLGIRENSIVIFSSDNGPVLDDGYEDEAVERCGDHRPAGPLRGGKYSMFDGGTRVPFILSWPGTVEPGESSALVSHVDFAASFARMTGIELEDDAAPDSLDVLDALLGRSDSGRTELVTEGLQAKTIIRKDNWVYIPPHDGPAMQSEKGIETGNSEEPQLYNLEQDVGQIRNLAQDEAGIVSSLEARLREIRAGDRTR